MQNIKMLVLHQTLRALPMNLFKKSSSSVTVAAKMAMESMDNKDIQKKNKNKSMVAAAFESLKEADNTAAGKVSSSVDSINEKILNAKTINGLLSVTESGGTLTRKHALKIVSILAEWSSINRVKLSEFENDSRFLKLCRMLGRTVPKNEMKSSPNRKVNGFQTEDLNTVLGIAGDDEAAKLVASISLPQMVKVMATLAHRKRRSIPLLRSLAFNISSASEQLDLKQSGDVLFAMASLNFPDAVLAAKVCSDILAMLPANTDKPAVVGSILTSLGLLKYRDLDVLEALSNWVLKRSDICRPQDISAMFLTLAVLNYKSENVKLNKVKLLSSVNKEDFPKKLDWLSHVWALSILGLVESAHVNSVLRPDFIQEVEMERNELTPNAKMKLLNINSFAKLLMENYDGALLSEDSPVFSVPLAHNKSKQILLNGMLDALKSLLTSSSHVKSLVDSKMGFLIDAECVLDSRRNPLPLNTENRDAIKIAIMVVDFHDMCHGTHRSLTGVTNLSFELLEKRGYKTLKVPYNEFNTSDKLLKRVQYLEAKFKDIVNKNS